MKTKAFFLALAASVFAASAFGQSYSIDWHTIAGGGGTSTGGGYSVSGTIGQPDAGTMSGSNYSLAGGFWGIVSAIQTPGAPLLSVRLTGTNSVIVSWPAPFTGFELQQSASLNALDWSTATTIPINVGGEKQVVIPIPIGNHFYRLRKP